MPAIKKEQIIRELKLELIEEICRRTDALRRPKRTDLSPKQELLAEILSSGFDGFEDKLRNLTQVITGLEIPDLGEESESYFKRGVCIVATGNGNGHNYGINKPCVVYEDGVDQCLRATGSTGNHIDRTSVRLATKEEIGFFVEKIEDNISVLAKILKKEEE